MPLVRSSRRVACPGLCPGMCYTVKRRHLTPQGSHFTKATTRRAQVTARRACPRKAVGMPPVEWLAEYRCFVCEGRVTAWSPYLSFGRPNWRPYGHGGAAALESASVSAFCKRLLAQPKPSFPPAFVVDVGLIEDRGWSVV